MKRLGQRNRFGNNINYFYAFSLPTYDMSWKAEVIAREHKRNSGQSIAGNGWRKTVARYTQLLLLLLPFVPVFSSVTAQAQDPLDTDTKYDIDIPQLDAATALNLLAEQTDVFLLFPYREAKNRQANPVTGRYRFMEALAILLKDSGLVGGRSKKGVVSISVLNAGSRDKDNGITTSVQQRKGVLATVMGFLFGSGTGAGADTIVDTIVDTTADTMYTERQPGYLLEELIVTATRREERLQDLAFSVSALQGRDLEERGIENFEDFSRLVPGLNIVQTSQQFSRFSIRGMELTTATSSNGEQKLATVYMDEIPTSSFSVVTPNLRLVDIERVEVLRGPQGTLFGAGSLSGAVRVITNKPKLDHYDARTSVDFGGLDGELRQRYTGVVNVPLSNSSAIRAVGYYREEPGYIDNINQQIGRDNINGSDEYGGRLSFRMRSADKFLMTWMVAHDNVENGGLNLFDPGLDQFNADLGFDNTIIVESTNYNATLEYDFDWAKLTSSTSHVDATHDWDFNAGKAVFNPVTYGLPPGDPVTLAGVYSELSEQSAIVEEIRLVSSGDSAWDWSAGIFYLDRETDWRSVIGYRDDSSNDPGVAGVSEFNITGLPTTISEGKEVFLSAAKRAYREKAAFGELTYHFTDEWKITGGLRYAGSRFITDFTGEEYSVFGPFARGLFSGGADIDVSDPENARSPIKTRTDVEYKLTKKFDITWQPTDNQTYYFLVADGFRRPHPNTSGFINGGGSTKIPDDPVIVPEFARSDSLWNYELGLKAQWFDRRLTTNVALYYIPWEDMQISLTRSSDGAVFTGNVGKAELYGVEFESQWFPTDTLELGFNLTLRSGAVKELNDEDALLSGAVEGAELASADIQASGFVQYRWIFESGDLFTRLDAQYVGSRPNAFPNRAGSSTANPYFAKIDAYENVDASVGWQDGSWTLTLYGTNILDNDDYTAILPSSNAGARFSTLTPRTLGVRMGWQL